MVGKNQLKWRKQKGTATGRKARVAGRFGDQRRDNASAALLQALEEKRTVVIKRLGNTRAEEIRFGRFLNNENVTHQEILNVESERVAACAAGRDVLVIQDTTEINFSGHTGSKKGFGTVGNGEDIGLFLHPQFVLDATSGGVLGIAGCAIMNRRRHVKMPSRKRPPDKRESRRWLEGMELAGRVLKESAFITVVADRESDIYEAFAGCPENVHLLTRAAQNRCLADGDYLRTLTLDFRKRRKAESNQRERVGFCKNLVKQY